MEMGDTIAQTAKILIVAQDGAGRPTLEGMLQQIGGCWLAHTAAHWMGVALAAAIQPDLILIDMRKPIPEAPDLVQALRAEAPAQGFLPVVAVTVSLSQAVKIQLLRAGVSDFLVEPFDTWDMMLRLGHLLDLRRVSNRLQEQEDLLADGLRVMVEEMDEARLSILESLAETGEAAGDLTGGHTQRVGQLAGRLAAALGCPPAEVTAICRAAPLHDIGKIQVPARIWDKPGPLTARERAEMQTHTTLGACLLDPGNSPLLATAREIALTHHERWDGSGYPGGLVGAAIPMAGRVVAVADAFDALTHDRPYRAALPTGQAIAEIQGQRGTQFDPAAVDAFMQIMAQEQGILSGALDFERVRAVFVPGSVEFQ
jgi:putative two-component system response regulator